MDYFDLAADHDGELANAFRGVKTRFCLASFTSDWLFPTSESRALVHALNAVAAPVSFVEIESDKGHDAFLLDEPEFLEIVRSEEHTSELQSLMRISYAVFCLKKKKNYKR